MNQIARLRDMGMRLQDQIALTRMRVAKLEPSSLRSRAARTLDIGQKAFDNIGNLVQATQRTQSFLTQHFNFGLRDLLNSTWGVEQFGLELLNARCTDILRELAELNRIMDEKEKENGKGSEKCAA